jgi:hypothetical protein
MVQEQSGDVFGSVPDPKVFGPPGSGSVSQMYGSGSFPFPIKVHKGVERTEIMLAKLICNTKCLAKN